ncbi:MAG TPA: RMD1 family protein [Candidatus Polarisedimenticolia bacterium]|nr:RMD1 family protein [Candidatus Polarisedimenticolia bacterium]
MPTLPVPTTTPSQAERLSVRAVYLEGQIDLKSFRAHNSEYPVLAADPLIVEPVRGSFLVITKFGALVFWNCPEPLQRTILSDTRQLMGGSHAEKMEDSLDVLVGTTENAVTFNEVRLKELSLDRVSIISQAVAQSVALDHIEREVAGALKGFEPVVVDIHSTGRLRLSVRQVLKAVGFALQVRSTVLANLTLFDRPPETWESEMLERLDSQLYDFFDLEERLSAINQKVAYFTDMSSIFMNLLSDRRNVQLELTIVVLILIEVVVFLWSILR